MDHLRPPPSAKHIRSERRKDEKTVDKIQEIRNAIIDGERVGTEAKEWLSYLLQQLDAAKQENAQLKNMLYIPCDVCGGSGFRGYGTGYDATCDCSGGYIGLLDAEEALRWRQKLKQTIEALEWYAEQRTISKYEIGWEVGDRARQTLSLIREEAGTPHDT
jgi:hypothetical protein